MKTLILFIVLSTFSFSLVAKTSNSSRQVSDFNFDWQFHLGDIKGAFLPNGAKSGVASWSKVRLPHDWAASLPYSKEGAASSTGFKKDGIGWYRKQFSLNKSDLKKSIWLEFDGVYNNSQILINGHFAGRRPSGYSSFKIDVSKFGIQGDNLVAVRVDRTAHNDARWYTGSGIYRDVRLVKTNNNHIAHWGVQILTPEVSSNKAKVLVNTQLNLTENVPSRLYVDIELLDVNGKVVSKSSERVKGGTHPLIQSELTIKQPQLWDLHSPNLYSAQVKLRSRKQELDRTVHTFGVRSLEFHTNNGFLLNGIQTKIKGVNLHHDAGVVGTAVPKEIWRYRLKKLQSIGVNAIRLSHNPHSPDLLDLADEMGFLVMAEMFDDWLEPKKKSVVFLSDNAGKGDDVKSYTEHFAQWAETDLTDLVKRDFNHPSVFMWSIGNEIEWTYPYYQKSLVYEGDNGDYHKAPPLYTPSDIKAKFDKNKGPAPD